MRNTALPRIVLAVLLMSALAVSPELIWAGFARVTGPCGFSFPQDHGDHPEHRTEWWYYTGNLEEADGRPFGFQLTFFRTRLAPPGIVAETGWTGPRSAWRTDQVYLAHASISDLQAGRFYQAQEAARGAVGLAGVHRRGGEVTVFLKNWSALIRPEGHRLFAQSDALGLDLDLEPKKGPVAHGDDGYSRKGVRPESASCYYSFPRLSVTGEIQVGKDNYRVQGLAWMDHEYSSEMLESDVAGWDWFSLQLSDGTELMAFFLRLKEGGYSPAVSGSFIEAGGRVTPIGRDDLRLEILDHWRSPATKARYPAGWRLLVDSLGLEVTIRPRLADQEMRTEATTGLAYWEGSVSAEGTAGGRPVSGLGYVELTGYAGGFRSPL